MGSKHSRGSSGVPDKLGARQVKVGRDLEEQPARKPPSSEVGNETVRAHSDGGSASRTVPQEEVNSFSLPAEETGTLPAEEPGPQELQGNSQEGGQPPSPSQSASSDKGPPAIRQTCELNMATPPVEHSSEKAERATPQIPRDAAGGPEAETGVVLSTGEGPSMDAELQTTAENHHGLAGSPVEKRSGEVSPCSPAEKEQDSKGGDSEDGSFEIITEVRPGLAASEMADGHSDTTPALVTKRLEAQRPAEAEFMAVEIAEADFMRAERAALPTAEPQVGKNEGRSAVDVRTAAGAEGQTASGIPQEAESESTLAQRALDTLEKPLASHAVEHAGTNAGRKSIDDIRNDGGYLTTEAMSLREEHPASATVHDPEAGPLPRHLDEPSSKVLQGRDEAQELSLLKETDGSCSGPAAIEPAQAQDAELDEPPRTGPVSSTEVTLAPAAQETRPVATAGANAQLRGSSGTRKGSTECPLHVRKQEARFPKTFYFCCGQRSAGDGEANAEQ